MMNRASPERVYARYLTAIFAPQMSEKEEREWLEVRYEHMRHWGWQSSDPETKWESALGTVWVERVGSGKLPWAVRGESRAKGRRYMTAYGAFDAVVRYDGRKHSDRDY